MEETSNSQLASVFSTTETHVDSRQANTVQPIEPSSQSLASVHGHTDRECAEPPVVAEAEEDSTPPSDREEDHISAEDEDWEADDDPGPTHTTDIDSDPFLDSDPANMSSWAGQPSVKGSSEVMRMMLLTFSSVGMTFTWGIEMTYCTPYLLSLGLTKGQTSMVWIAGPLSGLIVQPVIGVISDQSKSKWGRRRPIIMAATAVVVCSLLALGFTKEIVGIFIRDKQSAKVPTIALAVLALYATDFAINAVMSCSRSLVVDTLPAHKQQAGAAWGMSPLSTPIINSTNVKQQVACPQ